MTNTTYADLATLRTYPGIPAAGEDAYLQSLLNAAAGMVDGWCNTTFVSSNVALEKHNGTGSRYLQLRRRPVLSVSTVELDGTTYSSDAYEIDYEHGQIIIPDDDEDSRNPRIWRSANAMRIGWPLGTQNIAVSYSHGHSAVPDEVTVATCQVASGLYLSGKRQGVQSESLGPRSISYGTASQSMPATAKHLLDRYRIYEVGI